MKSIIPFIFKRKFGKDLLNKDHIPNYQENKINWINNKKCLNFHFERNNINNVIKPKFNKILIQKNNINITESKTRINPQNVDEYTPNIIKYII